jgi:hypothetical protein
MKPETREGQTVRVLPVVRLAGNAYFVDLEYRHFKETMNPGNYVDFDSVKGQRFCQEASVITCLGCGMSVIVPPVGDLADARYIRCSRMIGGR